MIGRTQFWKIVARISRARNSKIANSPWKYIGVTNLGLLTVQCDKFTDLKGITREQLSHEECIKQACLLSTNSATTLLTTATSAILDVCLKYKKSLGHILRLYDELLLTRGEISEIWENVVEERGKVDKMRAALSEMNNYMTSVEKVVNSTTEVAFLAGAEHLCTVLCERLYSAQIEITRTINEIKKLEDDFLKLEEEVAKTVNKKE